ncbi:MAG: hypothetical protein R2697_11100 [Ilumatobacteraceae bacterium]
MKSAPVDSDRPHQEHGLSLRAFHPPAPPGSSADEAFRSLTPIELDQLLEMAADRYLGTSGLFGTVDDAVETISACSTAGVDEVACLVDFGIDDDACSIPLPLLGEVHDIVRRGPTTTEPRRFRGASAPAWRHPPAITPSLATMLTADRSMRRARATSVT